MSHVPQASTPRPASADATALPGSHRTIATPTAMHIQQAPPQARRDFDAALRRAGTDDKPSRSTRRETESETPAREEPKGLATLAPLGALPGGMAAALAGGEALAGSAAMPQPQQAATGPLPTAVPATLAAQTQGVNGTAIGQQWRMSVPLDSATTPAALAMRLTQSGAGHWQVRLGTDTQTRQQLLPHMDRLRERLREHGQGRFDDLSFDDDTSV